MVAREGYPHPWTPPPGYPQILAGAFPCPTSVSTLKRMDLQAFPPDPFSYAAALASGMTRHQLRSAVESGALHRLARDQYARTGAQLADGERWQNVLADHLRRLDEALRAHPGCAASHDSAAALHGLPIVLAPGAEVHLLRVDDFPSSRRLPGVIVHHEDSVETSLTTVSGRRVTTPARTIADLLRTRRIPNSLAVLDQSIRAGLVTLDDVERESRQQRRWVGRVRAEQALAIVDPARESWAESYSTGAMHVAGRPLPIPQVDILDGSFTFLGRVDGFLDHECVFTEVDGYSKYLIGLPDEEPSETAHRRLAEEKLRHQRIERTGLAGARWTIAEAMADSGVIGERINEAIHRARSMTFTGWIRWQGRLWRPPLRPR